MMQTLEQKVVEAISQIQSLAKPGVEVAARVVRIDAIGDVITGLVFTGICIAVFWVAKKLLRAAMDKEKEYSPSFPLDWTDTLHIVGPAALLLLIFGFIAIVYLFDIWTWIGIVNPNLALAHELLTRMGCK